MSDLTEIVDSLENRLGEMLQKYHKLKQDQESLQEEVEKLRGENQSLHEGLLISENKIQSLKAANALLGSNEYKKETKLRINGLIREIDQCIVQLSE